MNRGAKIAIAVGIVLVCIRAALPLAIAWYVNKTLDESKNYKGHIEDVDLQLWRGAYKIQGIEIKKVEANIPVPFLKVPEIDLSIDWKEVFHGHLVGEVTMWEPQLNFVDGATEASSQVGAGESWQSIVKALFPIRLNRFGVKKGAIHFRNFQSDPQVDVSLSDVNLEATNLTNTLEISETLFAKIEAKAKAVENTVLELSMQLDPFAEKPTFDLNARVLDLSLPKMNNLFKNYLKLDFTKGTGSIVAEIASDEGKVSGYVKPLFKDLDVLSMEDVDEGDNIFELLWEGVSGAVAEVFENQQEDQFASKVPLNGRLPAPDVGILDALGAVLYNAFIKAFKPVYDRSISLSRRKTDR